jgi:hypothetical protein
MKSRYKQILNMKYFFKFRENGGSISIFVLVMGVVMSLTIGGLALFGSVQYTTSRRGESYQKAVTIAEAGVNYYKWHLAHDPTDYQDGIEEEGPYEHDYLDPQGGIIGKYSLDIIPPDAGSEIVTIKSTGWSLEHPTIKRTVTAEIGPDSLAKYSFLHNSTVWFGQGIFVSGEVFSNGGIRMDGEHDSLVKSAKETYTCGTETGCWPPQTKDGVWGNGGTPALWQFPVTTFDFDSVVTDFNELKDEAQSTGVYLSPSSYFGYHLVFNSDGSVQVYEVTSADNKKGRDADSVCQNLFQIIDSESLLGSYDLTEKGIFYAEDDVWVDGTVSGKGTVVAARLPVGTYTTNIFITDNLVYDVDDGSSVLGVIAQNNIIFGYDIPTDFYVSGILMAQSGSVLRHAYNSGNCTNGSRSSAVRQNLTIFGSIISNLKSYWNFSGMGGVRSGFINRVIIYNQDAAEDPPPYYPSTGDLKLLRWRED